MGEGTFRLPEDRLDMKWTISKPTISGWYWAYEDYGDAYIISIVEVVIRNQEPSFGLSGDDGKQPLDFWDAWLGPIEVPEPPFMNKDGNSNI